MSPKSRVSAANTPRPGARPASPAWPTCSTTSPRRYIDRSLKTAIASVPIGTEVTIIGTVREVRDRRPRRNMHIIEAVIEDDSARIKAVWFNQSFRLRQLESATEVAFSGVVESFRGSLQMKSPEVDVLGSRAEGLTVGRVVPVHSTVGGVGPGYIRRAIYNALPAPGRSTTPSRSS